MGWGRWLLHDWYTASEFDEMERRQKLVSKSARQSREKLRNQCAELRADVAALALLARSLAELCIERGVLTQDELKQRMLALDVLDGVRDSALDPKLAVPGSAKPANPTPRTAARTTPPRKRT